MKNFDVQVIAFESEQNRFHWKKHKVSLPAVFEVYIVMPKHAFESRLKKFLSNSVSAFSLTSVFSTFMSPTNSLGQK